LPTTKTASAERADDDYPGIEVLQAKEIDGGLFGRPARKYTKKGGWQIGTYVYQSRGDTMTGKTYLMSDRTFFSDGSAYGDRFFGRPYDRPEPKSLSTLVEMMRKFRKSLD
jgi:hypothetical protein